jgi:hypothetical protein
MLIVKEKQSKKNTNLTETNFQPDAREIDRRQVDISKAGVETGGFTENIILFTDNASDGYNWNGRSQT